MDPGVLALVARLREQREQIAQTITDYVQRVVPDPASKRDAAFRAGILPAALALLDYRLEAIEHGGRSDSDVPVEALRQVRRAARAGVKPGTLLRRHVAGHRQLSEYIARAAADLGLPSDHPALHRVRITQDELLEQITAATERAYEQELARTSGAPRPDRSTVIIRSLLEDRAGDPAELERLGYRLDAWHVALIATGTTAGRALAKLAPQRTILLANPDANTGWAWVAARERPACAELESLISNTALAELSLGVGEPGNGLAGWRRSHQQAQEAHGIAASQGLPGAVRYKDVALIAPWLAHPERAREFIDLFLAPLAAKRDGGAAARQTLDAYLKAGRNVTAAAQQLGVDRRTVAYRLQGIEEILGRPLNTRMAELEVALRLDQVLPKALVRLHDQPTEVQPNQV